MPEDLKSIGRYEIVKVLGKGAMGVVYLAHDPLLKRLLAIKTVREFNTETESTLLRFQREAEISARLNHPNIVTIHDVGNDPQAGPFLAMEYVDGSSLGDLIKAGIPLETTFKLLFQGMRALLAAERADITHRDVKPGNIMVGHDGRLKLMDFGIARGEGTRLTQVGHIIGTPSYTAPELLMGGEPNPASDRYAFAVTAFQMITGSLPFECTTVGATLFRIVHEPPLFPDDLSPEMRTVFEKAFAKIPEDRYSDMASFLEALLLAVDLPPKVRTKYLIELENEPGSSLATRVVSNATVRIVLNRPPKATPLPSEAMPGMDLPTEIVCSTPTPDCYLPTSVMEASSISPLPLPTAPGSPTIAVDTVEISGAAHLTEEHSRTADSNVAQIEPLTQVMSAETEPPTLIEETVALEVPIQESELASDSMVAVPQDPNIPPVDEEIPEISEVCDLPEDLPGSPDLKNLPQPELLEPVIPTVTGSSTPIEETLVLAVPVQEIAHPSDALVAAPPVPELPTAEEEGLDIAEILDRHGENFLAEDLDVAQPVPLEPVFPEAAEPSAPIEEATVVKEAAPKKDLAVGVQPQKKTPSPPPVKKRGFAALVLAALLLLVVGGGGTWLWQTRFADFPMEITSSPEGARVLVDGRELGRTNLPGARIPRRGGTLRLEMEGFEPMELDIHRGNAPVHAVLVRSPYPISIVTEPAGAEVLLNGAPKGLSPLQNLTVPSEGRQELTLRLKDHAEWNCVLNRDVALPAVIQLEMTQLTFRITSAPPGAEAFLNGKRIGKTPLPKVEIPSGMAANLTLKHAGYKDWQGTLNDGRPVPDPIYLVPMIAHFVVRTEPAGATVYIDGTKVGQSPLSDVLVPYLGSHSIHITHEGFQDWSATLDPAKSLPDPIHLVAVKKVVQAAPVAPPPQLPKAAPPPEKKKGFWKKVFGSKDVKPDKETPPPPPK